MKEVVKIKPKLSYCSLIPLVYTNIGRMVIGTAWFFGVLFAQSCATNTPKHAWISDGIKAQALQDRGEYEKARTIYTRLLSSPVDLEHSRWISYKLAQTDLKQGNEEKARVRATKIHNEKIIDEYGAKSLFLIAQIEKDDEIFWEVVSTYPESYAAEKSLKQLERLAETHSQRVDFAKRARHQIETKESSLEDNLLLSEARSYIANSQPNLALPILRELFHRDETESLADEALWEIAGIYRAAQQWQDALDVYAIFRGRIEHSFFVGTYTPDLVNDSIFESGMISLVFLGNYVLSISYFEDYLTLFPDSLLADDALWFLAESHRLSGNVEKRKDTLDRLAERFPDSRFRRRVKRQGGNSEQAKR